jgi:hypothetical protein
MAGARAPAVFFSARCLKPTSGTSHLASGSKPVVTTKSDCRAL